VLHSFPTRRSSDLEFRKSVFEKSRHVKMLEVAYRRSLCGFQTFFDENATSTSQSYFLDDIFNDSLVANNWESVDINSIFEEVVQENIDANSDKAKKMFGGTAYIPHSRENKEFVASVAKMKPPFDTATTSRTLDLFKEARRKLEQHLKVTEGYGKEMNDHVVEFEQFTASFMQQLEEINTNTAYEHTIDFV
jgi:hypothetical protein